MVDYLRYIYWQEAKCDDLNVHDAPLPLAAKSLFGHAPGAGGQLQLCSDVVHKCNVSSLAVHPRRYLEPQMLQWGPLHAIRFGG